MIEIVSVGSSSSGNSYIIMTEGRTILIDAGLPAKRIISALEQLGTDPADVDAVLITHEHIDHVKSVRAISRKCRNAFFYASRGTVESTESFCHVPQERIVLLSAGEIVRIDNDDDVEIGAFPLSHDAAEPLGFTVTSGGEKLAVVTDTGVVTEEIYSAISDAGVLVFEANHDVDMLMFGDYPYPVKVRIKGEKGHLSNDYAGEVIASILADRKSNRVMEPLRIMLAHLSFHNNAPLFARQTVEDALSAAGFHRGEDYTLEVAAREGLTFIDPLNVEDGKLIVKREKDA
ncbi:MAG: MBL fold metallo-hydrolase [Mogibacterium sp.]|nr:MBL fold metallo-hydrolase [Mogibacterium sp.]